MSVAVALSGGADSLLALSLLQEQGCKPVAFHASFWGSKSREHLLQEELAAVCARMGVSFHRLDLRRVFDREVVQPFIRDYARGLTPNPCAWCNRRIKFKALMRAVLDLGLTRMATGHYAGLVEHCPSPPGLFRGCDRDKDQSYFLALVGREHLKAAHFPLAEWTKDQVHAELAKRGLYPVSGRESQEICFIPDNDYRAFLAAQDICLPGEGKIVDVQGRTLGRHQGLHRYTVGQRRGLGIAYSEPLYVLAKDMGSNTLVVGPRRQLQAASCRVRLTNALVEPEYWPQHLWVQTNYRQAPGPVRVGIQEKDILVSFEQPRTPGSPGQIAVFYSEQGRVLGGGEIHV